MDDRTFVIACATVIEKMLPLLPPGMGYRVLDFGLHVNPPALKEALQEAIDAAGREFDTVLLGYGLCSQAIVGLKVNGCALAMAVATSQQSGVVSLNTMRAVKADFPEVHLTCGLSNISFGLPTRTPINQAFLTLALAAGLDSAILDPLDREPKAAILAAELVLGRDRFSRNYTQAYQAGLLG